MIEPRIGAAGGATADPAAWPAGVVGEADRARFAAYAEALAFAEGAQWGAKRRRGETRLTFNYARALVRKVASYVFPAPVGFSVPSRGDDAAASRAERALADLQAELDLGRLDVELCVDGSILGDAAIKVTWDAALARPVVAPVDPATLVADRAPDDPRRVVRMNQLYALTGGAIAGLFEPEEERGKGNGSTASVPLTRSASTSTLVGATPSSRPGRRTAGGSRSRGRRCGTGRTRTVGFRTWSRRTTPGRTPSGARATWSTSTMSAAS